MLANHPGLLVAIPLALFAVAYGLDRLERWLIGLWVRAGAVTHEEFIGLTVAGGSALAVILLAVVL